MVVMLATAVSSCIDDESSEADTPIPTIEIAGGGDAAMKEYNFDLGTDCVIKPDVEYDGTGELKYTWSVGTYDNNIKGELKEVGHDRELTYRFDKGGAYYAHLVVTDGRVGQVADYRVNINRTFENGFLLVSSTESGVGNLAFIKTMTPEETAAGKPQVVMQHCFERMNGGLKETTLRGVALTTLTWPTTLTRLLVSMEDKCYFVDPNTLTAVSSIDYADAIPGFKADRFLPDSYSPYAYDRALGRYVHLNLQYMFPYEKSEYKNSPFDDFILSRYTSVSGASSVVLCADYGKNVVATYNAYAPYYGYDTYFPSTGSLLDGNELITAFNGEKQDDATYLTPLYVMARSKANPAEWTLFVNPKGTSSIAASNFTAQRFTASDDTATPSQGTRFMASTAYHRFFYAIGNRVYVFLTETAFTLPSKEQYAIRFADTEEVTFIDTNLDTEQLYVATYDKSTKKGNFYIFSNADVKTDNKDNVKPVAKYTGCADRITDVLYKKSISR